jgi:hypothetical protein
MSDSHLLPALDTCVVICFRIDEVEIVEIAINQMRFGAHHLEEPFSVTARQALKCRQKVPPLPDQAKGLDTARRLSQPKCRRTQY